ncbi:MAG TPA: hypothetical protein H9771_09690 [Candidatus Faecalibacterium faecipullorum]|uniref:Lipoprotein n=1 Tax=Candidatus Faecalibacterium faecipullorum TaxID=2838578 RepID=A0A9D2MH24_9FIRM|nr:hypothetical protein [Candidatus Faecalibacterium faecipullorum]
MKLKKIASLMLAGIMAVSMLAACGEGTGNNNGGANSEPTAPTSTTTTDLYSKLDKDNQKNISPLADTDLDSALAAAVDRIGTIPVAYGYALSDDLVTVKTNGIDGDILSGVGVDMGEMGGKIYNSLLDAAKILSDKLEPVNPVLNPDAIVRQLQAHPKGDASAVAFFMINGTTGIDSALNEVAEELDTIVASLPLDSDENGKNYMYKYTLSASVDSKTIDLLGTMTANYIAVKIDRTTVQR